MNFENILSIILFIFYLLTCIVLLQYWVTKKIKNVSAKLLLTSFLIRICFGSLYALLPKIGKNNDIWFLHNLSVNETIHLLEKPKLIFTNIFNIQHYINEYSLNSLVESIQYGFFIKLISVLNLFTNSNYYVNVIYFSFFTTIASCFLYKFFQEIFTKEASSTKYIIFYFFPCLFWTSAVRKDGLIFIGICIFLYTFLKLMKSFSLKQLFILLLAFFIIFLNRYWVAISLIPISFAWLISVKGNWKPLNVFLIVFIISSFFLFFFRKKIFFLISSKNNQFINEGYKPIEPTPYYKGTFGEFLYTSPRVIENAFLKPFPIPKNSISITTAGFINTGLILLYILYLFFPLKLEKDKVSSLLAIGYFCLINYFLIGLVVPYLPAIIRYRTTFELIMLITLTSIINWGRVNSMFLKNIKN